MRAYLTLARYGRTPLLAPDDKTRICAAVAGHLGDRSLVEYERT